ncbi:MAG: HEAT repeat domain-containing protein, partial [Methanocella sp.]
MNNDQLSHKQLNDLFEALEKDDIAGSVGLIEQIGDAKNALALEPLLVLLGFHDERVRGSSATALGKLGMGPAVEPLIKALRDPSVIVQEKAAIALGIIGDGRATGPLENVSPDHYRVKRAAEYSLLQIESKNKKESLFKNNVAGGRPVIISPLRPVAPDGGQAYSPKPVEPQVRKIESPPPDTLI